MDVRRRCDECNRPLHSNQVAKCGGCCTKELKKMRRDLGYDNKQLVSEMTSQSRSQIKELEAQSRKQIEELDAKSTLKIQQLEAQSRVQIEDLQARLDFLRLRFDNDQADGIGKKDVLIVVTGDGEDEFLYCHKVVLAGRSPVFCKMFEAEMLEKETGMIRIEDTTLPVMRAVIKFCYTADIDFDEQVNLEEVLEVAHKYAIGALFKICEGRLAKSIDNVNLPRRLKMAKKFEAKALQAVASEHLKKHYDELIVAVVDEGL